MAPRSSARADAKSGARPARSRSRSQGPRDIDATCIAAARVLAAEQPTAGKSGHPGAPLGCAPMAHALWGKTMRFSPKDPKWPNRDRFVLSNGHACALQYAMLHLCGYDLTLTDLENFRKLGSRTPGHPENFMTVGVEVCTGPLGQGLANGVGLALAGAHLAAKYNRPGFQLFDAGVFVICGDGCLMEGVTSEAAALAAQLQLPRLAVLYDDNKITIDGSTDLAFTEDVGSRFSAYGWNVSSVTNGDADVKSIVSILEASRQAEGATGKPTLAKVQTTIGYGSVKANTAAVHGAPLAADDLQQMRRAFGLPEDKAFNVPKRVTEYYRARGAEGNLRAELWQDLLRRYEQAHQTDHAELTRRLKGVYSASLAWASDRAQAALTGPTEAGDAVLTVLASELSELVGGSMAGVPPLGTKGVEAPLELTAQVKQGRHVSFGGGREHAAAACCLGLAAYGGFVPYWRCPLSELGNAWGAVRLSALGRFRVIHVATHDGEEASEILSMCRATPNLALFRPADAAEVAGAYGNAISSASRPTVIALPPDGTARVTGSCPEAAARGGYVLAEFPDSVPQAAVIVATGTEVSPCLEVHKLLFKDGIGIRIVSLPSWEVFEEQPEEYRDSVLGQQRPKQAGKAAKVSSHPWPIFYAEAPTPFGFERYASHCLQGFGDVVDVAAQVRALIQAQARQSQNGV